MSAIEIEGSETISGGKDRGKRVRGVWELADGVDR